MNPQNRHLLNSCKVLREYAILIHEIRSNLLTMDDESKAIDAAVKKCIKKGVLKDVSMANEILRK